MEQSEEKLNGQLKKLKKVQNIMNICILIFILFFIIDFKNIFPKIQLDISMFFTILSACIMFIAKTWYKNSMLTKIKKQIFAQILPELLCDNQALSYKKQPAKYKVIYDELGIPKSEFVNSGIYENYTDYYTSDGLKTFSGDLYIANVKAVRKTEDRKVEVFTGVFGYIQTEEFYEDEIIIKPDIENKYIKNLVDDTNKIIGDFSNTVRLENSEFEKYFEVYSKNQIEARKIITPYYMENLLKQKQDLNTPIKIRYKGNKKYIAIWNIRIIDEKEIYKNGINLESIKTKIKKIITLLNV